MSDSELRLRQFVEAIFDRYHYDFRDYASSSLYRRIAAALPKLNCRTLDELWLKVESDQQHFFTLLDTLTVQVSEMFRDPAYYQALREKVLPHLRTYPSLKVWVAGCSAGEEAYSLAILLREAGLLERSLIYATDINPHALRRAENGIYNSALIARYTENHRLSGATASFSDYYTAAYDRAAMDRSLRKHIVFSDHSLATDSVFAEVQLVSCRNVLIYFNRDLQERALGLFTDSLCRKGFLGIGMKESIRFSPHRTAYDEVAREVRVFQKSGRAPNSAAALLS